MKKTLILGLAFFSVLSLAAQFKTSIKMDDYPLEKRTVIDIPNILGYQVLKCDFHMHTPNSDGNVTAQTRVQEAWEEGLDAISITDHISHKKGQKNENQAYELGIKEANKKGIIFVKGGEITFGLNPGPGHANALFLQDVNKLQSDDWRESFNEAKKQGAFIFWNHPGWAVDTIRWYKEHTELFNGSMLHGIEVFNEFEYYPEAAKWCLDKNLTFIGNTDVHSAINRLYDFSKIKHRPLTLVLSKSKTESDLKEALFAGRTLIYAYNMLIGKEEYVKALVDASLKQSDARTLDTNTTVFTFSNTSDIDFTLIKVSGGDLPKTIVVPGRSSIDVIVKNEKLQPTQYEVQNSYINGYYHLRINLFE